MCCAKWTNLAIAAVLSMPITLLAADDASSSGKPGGKKRDFLKGGIIEKLDKNGDGKVSESEAPERMKHSFAKLDADGDGAIDSKEFQSAREKMSQRRGDEKRGKSGDNKAFGGGELFAKLDSNNDGKISKEEAPERMKNGFARLDENGDGSIDENELAKVRERMQKARPEGNSGKGADGRFGPEGMLKRFDTDGNGKLSAEEAPERMRKHFTTIDSNSDGNLSIDEMGIAFRKMAEVAGGKDGSERGKKLGASDVEPKRIFNDQDLDADGRVAKSEAKGVLSEKFATLDTNGDGKLEILEVENGLSKIDK